MNNYVMFHDHTNLSNPTSGTKADSVAKYKEYLDKAQELGMKAFAFSEHGNILNWIAKKTETEKRGMKYIHAIEIYLTEKIDLDNGLVRDNYHTILIAKNYDGVLELNKLSSKAFIKEDGHSYYNPRITFEELMNTSDNIIVSTACLASPLWKHFKKQKEDVLYLSQSHEKLIQWMIRNKHRVFLEVQYHNHQEQIEYNLMLLEMSKKTGIPLIAGTDTHSLDEEQAETRKIFLQSKGASYGDEDTFDLTFKSYDELVRMFEKQSCLPKKVYLEAINNTNIMADMVEEFTLDTSPKYPKIFENPVELFKQKINEGVVKRGFNKFNKEKREEYYERIQEEFKTYQKLDAIDYMLIQKNIIDWCHENDIYQGFSRGSVSGSQIAYTIGVTDVDSIKHNLNFFRFLNPDRVSLADIDVDFPPSRRQDVIDYVASLREKYGIYFAEIVTFNKNALKGSIRDVGRGLNMPLDEVDEIAKAVKKVDGKDVIDDSYRSRYQELFKHVDKLVGTVTSFGSHPSGVVISPIPLEDNVGTIFTGKSKYCVTSINMKELDSQNYVKLDILGLDNIELINETCKLAGIERLTPDNIDIYDNDVWKSLTESTLGVFQFESQFASSYLKQLYSDDTLENIKNNVGDIDYMDLLSMANASLRPSGASYRDNLANGIPKDNGHESLNEFLKPTLGNLIYQEQIMNFLTHFCEHTGSESDMVRRGLAKKEGTEVYLPKIEKGFMHYMIENYGGREDDYREVLDSFLQIIKDASNYGFSINHSQPYSYIGYACAWLRYYYPLEFLTVALNTWQDNEEKTSDVIQYMKQKGIKLQPIAFGKSRAVYSCDKETNSIYKGLASIKFLNSQVAEELYELSKKNKYDKDNFVDLLIDIYDTSAQSNQMEILIRLDFFKQFGKKEVLLEIYQTFFDIKKANLDLYPEFAEQKIFERTVKKRDGTLEEKWKTVKKLIAYKPDLKDSNYVERMKNIFEYQDAVKKNSPPKIELAEQIQFEKKTLGYVVTTFENIDADIVIVLDIDTKYTPVLTLYKLQNGEEFKVKIMKKKFFTDNDQLIYSGDIIRILELIEKNGFKMVDGKWIENENKKDLWCERLQIVKRGKRNE